MYSGDYYATVEFTSSSDDFGNNVTVNLTSVVSSVSSGIDTDLQTLTEIYNSLNGANWTNSTNWLSGTDFSNWYGVSVDNNGRLVGLNLSENGLIGVLPETFADLNKVTSIDLSYNHLEGTVPAFPEGASINISFNKFHFDDLNPSLVEEVYYPQRVVLADQVINGFSMLKTGGESYSWFEDESLVGSTGLFEPTDFGLYFAEVSHSSYPNLILKSVPVLGGEAPIELDVDQVIIAKLETRWYRNGEQVQDNFSESFNPNLSGDYHYEVDYLIQEVLEQVVITVTSEIVNIPFGVDTDRLALMDLYENGGGSEWTSANNWGIGNDLNTWEGVVTNENGRVISLSLSNNGLRGAIPASIGNLSFLRALDLSGNGDMETTVIPSEIGNLSKELIHLDLSKSWLTGPIPSEFYDLVNLEYLSVDGTTFEPSEINDWQGDIGPEWASFSKLKILSVPYSHMERFPPALCQLTNLEYLDFGTAYCENIPSEISQLINLKTLKLGRNSLRSIPENLFDLEKLEVLDLQNNFLTNGLPNRFNQLENLTDLNLSKCRLQEIPSSVYALRKITHLRLSEFPSSNIGSKISGQIPSELGDMIQLKHLDFSNQQFSGAIPQALGNLVNLEFFSVSNNDLTGAVPTSFSNPSFRTLLLNDNNLSGTLPPLQMTRSGVDYTDKLELQNNSFTYTDFLTNNANLDYYLSGGSTDYKSNVYGPQADIDPVWDGSALSVAFVGGNTHQWYLDGLPIPGETASTITPTTTGSYHCVLNHSLFPQLELSSTSHYYDGGQSRKIDENQVVHTSALSVYPNPFSDVFYVELKGDVGSYQFRLFDTNGKTVPFTISTKSTHLKFDVVDVKAGVYFLLAKNGDTVVRKKLVVVK